MTLNLNSPPQTHTDFTPRITVIGVGGGGTNAVDNMIAANLRGVDFVVANTDAQQLMHSKADRRVQLGPHITQGLGAGAKPEIGRAAAEEAADELYRHLDGAHMVFITAGMGGGTGTGAAPVIARMAKERGILTVGVVTKPFGFEGSRRARAAEEGIAELQQYVDTLIVIPNQNLFNMATERTTWKDAFKMADQVLYMGVRGVTDLMMVHGLINLDFADIKTVMAEMGKAMMGTGEAEGEGRAARAAELAINNQLLEETSMAGARGLLINITGGDDLTLFEVDEAVSKVREQVDDEANVLFGSAVDESLAGRIRVSVVATGIDNPRYQEQPRPKLVAVGGGGGVLAEPRAIPVPMGGTVAIASAGWHPDGWHPDGRHPDGRRRPCRSGGADDGPRAGAVERHRAAPTGGAAAGPVPAAAAHPAAAARPTRAGPSGDPRSDDGGGTGRGAADVAAPRTAAGGSGGAPALLQPVRQRHRPERAGARGGGADGRRLGGEIVVPAGHRLVLEAFRRPRRGDDGPASPRAERAPIGQ